MDRLTYKNIEGWNVLCDASNFDKNGKVKDTQQCDEVCSAIGYCGDCPIQKAINKLADYEKAEEQGLLLKLPCKVGDKVYFKAICDCVIVQREYGATTCPFEDDCEFEECENGNERLFETTVSQIYNDKNHWYFIPEHFDIEIPLMDFGRTVFLTKEEAEAALQAMQEGE